MIVNIFFRSFLRLYPEFLHYYTLIQHRIRIIVKLPQKSGAIPLSHHITDCEVELRTILSSSSFSGNFPPNQWGEGEVVVRFLACETILVGFSECKSAFCAPGGVKYWSKFYNGGYI